MNSENKYQNVDRVISSLYTFTTVGGDTVKLQTPSDTSALDLMHFKVRHTSDVRVSIINDIFIDAQFKLISRDDSTIQLLRTRSLSHPVRVVIRTYTEKEANNITHPINNDLRVSTLLTHKALARKLTGVQMQICALDAKQSDLLDVVRSNKYLVDLLSYLEKQSKDTIVNIQVLEAFHPENTMIDAVKKRPEVAFELILQVLATLDALTDISFVHGSLTVNNINVAELSSANEPKTVVVAGKHFYLTQPKLSVKVGTFTHSTVNSKADNQDLPTLLSSLTNLEDAGGHLKMLYDANKKTTSIADLVADQHFQKFQKGGGRNVSDKLRNKHNYVESENTEQFYGVTKSASSKVESDGSDGSNKSDDDSNPFISSSKEPEKPSRTYGRVDFDKLNKQQLQEYLKRTQSSTESDSSDSSDESSKSSKSSDSSGLSGSSGSDESSSLDETSSSSDESDSTSTSAPKHGRPRNTSRIRQLNETGTVYNKSVQYRQPQQPVQQPSTRFGSILGMPQMQQQMQQQMVPTNTRFGAVLNQHGGNMNTCKMPKSVQKGGAIVPHIPDAAGTPFRTNQHRETDAARYNEKAMTQPNASENDSLVEVRISKDIMNPGYMTGKPPAVPQNPLAFNPFMPINYSPYMGGGLPGMGPPMYPWTYDINKVPIVRQIKVNLSNPGGDHITLSKIYEDIIPDEKFKYSFSTLTERMGMMQILRQILLRFNQNGEHISVGSDTNTSYNSKDQQLINLLHHVKYLEVNPQHTGVPTPNPYDSLPVGMLTFQAAYPIRYNAEYNTVAIARNAIGLILRFLMTKAYHWSPNSVYRGLYFDVWRERRYYEWIRDEIVHKLVSPNFALMHAYFFTDNDRIQWGQIGGRATQQEEIFDRIITRYSGETSNQPSLTLLMLTESYTNSLRKWTTPVHSDHGKAQRMINIGYYAPNVWESVIFQILSIMCVLEKYQIYMNVDPQALIDHFFIRDLRQNQQNTGYWRYTIDGVDYYCHNQGYLVIFDSRYFRKNVAAVPAASAPGVPSAPPSGASSVSSIPVLEFKMYSPVVFPGDEHRVVIDTDGMTTLTDATSAKHTDRVAAAAAAAAVAAPAASATPAITYPEPYEVMHIKQYTSDEIRTLQRTQFQEVMQFVLGIAQRAALPSIVSLVENINDIMRRNPDKPMNKLLPEMVPYALHSRIGSVLYVPEEEMIQRDLANFRRGELVIYNNGIYKQWALFLGMTSTGRMNIITKATPTDTLYLKKTVARGTLMKYHPNKKVELDSKDGVVSELENYVLSY